MTSTPKVLDQFERIGDDVFVRDPPKDDSGNPVQPSATIIACFWMGASQRNAAKYLAEYIRLAPGARIVFVLTAPGHLFLRASEKSRRMRIIPAVKTLLSPESSNAPMYSHVFSNGGAFTIRHIAIEYQRATGKPLPTNALLIDSAPGQPSLTQTHKALSYSFPKFFFFRIIASVLVSIGLRLMRLFSALMRQKNPVSSLRQALNDAKLIPQNSKRCYLYSQTDELIAWQDVEDHAAEAKKMGWEVSMEKFVNSPHVMHMKTDPERYWKIVAKYLAAALA